MTEKQKRISTIYLKIAAVMGALAVGFGAFGAHGLKAIKSAEMMVVFNTGARYHLIHAVLLVALALAIVYGANRWILRAYYCIFSGTVIFSGSLYLLSITEQKWFGMLTPVGGVIIVIGWLLIAGGTLRHRPTDQV